MKDVIKHFFVVAICLSIIASSVVGTSGLQVQIPFWIKNIAKWWYEGKISDSEFAKGIQYLIQNKILVMPASNSTTKENTIPTWIKKNAGWWANGTISDIEFVTGIQYLINAGIIYVNSEQNSTVNDTQSRCGNITTAADKETCLQQIEYDSKIKNAITTSTLYVVGPIDFYLINSESQSADNGKSLLTVHFLVVDNSDEQVTMSCQRQDSCNYALSDGDKEIPYTTNTLVYGSLTLAPKIPKFVDWTFYDKFDNTKNYNFLITEPWGTDSIPLKIRW